MADSLVQSEAGEDARGEMLTPPRRRSSIMELKQQAAVYANRIANAAFEAAGANQDDDDSDPSATIAAMSPLERRETEDAMAEAFREVDALQEDLFHPDERRRSLAQEKLHMKAAEQLRRSSVLRQASMTLPDETGQTPMGGSPFHSPSGSERSLADLVAAPSGSSARGEKPPSPAASSSSASPAAASPSAAAPPRAASPPRGAATTKATGGSITRPIVVIVAVVCLAVVACAPIAVTSPPDVAAPPPPCRAPLAFLSTLHAKVGARLPGDMPAFAQSAIAWASTTAHPALVNTTRSLHGAAKAGWVTMSTRVRAALTGRQDGALGLAVRVAPPDLAGARRRTSQIFARVQALAPALATHANAASAANATRLLARPLSRYARAVASAIHRLWAGAIDALSLHGKALSRQVGVAAKGASEHATREAAAAGRAGAAAARRLSRQMANRTAVVAKATAGWTRLKTAQSASSLKSHVSTTTSVVRQQTATALVQGSAALRTEVGMRTKHATCRMDAAGRIALRASAHASRAALGKADAAYQGVCRMAGPHARATLMAFNQSVCQPVAAAYRAVQKRAALMGDELRAMWLAELAKCGCAAPNARLEAPPSSSGSSWTLW